MTQQGDVYLYNTTDGGDINAEDGVIEMRGGLETAVYLSLFGGNHDDPGSGDSARNWWGNIGETDPARRYRSESQSLIDGLPSIPDNLRRIEDATERDLEWLIEAGAATSIAVTATMPGPKRIRRHIKIVADLDAVDLVYEENWRAEL